MRTKVLTTIEPPRTAISAPDYQLEKRHLFVEVPSVQRRWVKAESPRAAVFEGCDATGKSSRIKRFVKHPMLAHAVCCDR